MNDNVVYRYNVLNQLSNAKTKDKNVSFTYAADGLRTSKTVNGETTVFVWDDDQIVMELSDAGKVQNVIFEATILFMLIKEKELKSSI